MYKLHMIVTVSRPTYHCTATLSNTLYMTAHPVIVLGNLGEGR